MNPPNPLADTIIGLYERHADTWLGRRNPAATLEAAWLARFVAGLPADVAGDAGAEVLDIGCGTGQPLAQWLVQQGLRVTGVDSSAAMLAHARRLQPDQNWVQADMRQLQLGRRFAGPAGLGQLLPPEP
jgi:2-polyprenyl-3-methyl-5-hydroxy-6-metoxy-1,4-benzoquinol methylase